MSSPLRVLHVISGLAPRYGGPPQVCLELCRELARQGTQVSIYTTNVDGEGVLDVPLDAPVRWEGVEIRYFPVEVPRAWVVSRSLARALRRAVPAHDLVHVHSLYLFPSTVAAHYSRRFGVPYLIRPHGTLDPYLFHRHRVRKWVYERLFEWRNLNRAAAIHFTSHDEQELVRPLGLRAPGVVVPPGVHFERYRDPSVEGTFRAAWPETRGRRLVLFLGRLNFKKGLDLLARAFGEVARRRPDVHLVLAGPDDDGYAPTVRRWLDAEGVLDRATFTGMLLGRDKLAALRDADVFVLPSYTENFGMAVVEAMACGRPVVISDRVNIWREVAAAGAGRVTRCDAGEVAAALLAFLDDPPACRAAGERAAQLVAERFAWPASADAMLHVYRSVVAGGEPGTAEGPASTSGRAA